MSSHHRWSAGAWVWIGLGCLAVGIPLGPTGSFAAESDLDPPEVTYLASVSPHLIEDWIEFSSGASAEADRNRHIQDLLLTLTLAQEARRRGLDSQFEVRLKLERQRFRLLQPLLKKVILASVGISDQQVETRWLEMRDSFTRPRRSRLRNIFKRFAPGSDQAAKESLRRQMAVIRARILDGESFAQLAEEESDSQTRLQGGLLGNVRPGTLRAEIDAVAMALEVGEVSEILEAEDGLTLLFCEQKLDPVVRSEQELRKIARDQLVHTEFRRRWQALQEQLADRSKVRFLWEVLRKSPRPDARAVWIEFEGGSLTIEETVRIWTGKVADVVVPEVESGDGTGVEALGQVPEAKLTAAIEAYLLPKMSIREALSRGLHEQPGVERRWFWQQQQVLSSEALAAMIQERLRPISEQDQRAYFDRSIQAQDPARPGWVRPAHFRLTVLALPAAEQNLKRVYEQGAEIRQSILKGELSLENAARRFSVDPSGQEGGDVGWVSRWQIPKRFGIDFLREMQRLSPGELGKWVLSEGHLWLLRLEEIQAPRKVTFEEAKDRIENEIGQQRVAALEGQIIAEWLEKLDIRFADAQ